MYQIRVLCPINTKNELLALEQFLYASDASHEVGSFVRQVDRLRLLAVCEVFHHLDILLSEQIVCRIGTLAHSLGNLSDGYSLGFGFADTSLSLTLGTQNLLLLVSLGTVDG